MNNLPRKTATILRKISSHFQKNADTSLKKQVLRFWPELRTTLAKSHCPGIREYQIKF